MGGGVLLAPRTSWRRQHLSLARRSVTAASMGGGGFRGDSVGIFTNFCSRTFCSRTFVRFIPTVRYVEKIRTLNLLPCLAAPRLSRADDGIFHPVLLRCRRAISSASGSNIIPGYEPTCGSGGMAVHHLRHRRFLWGGFLRASSLTSSLGRGGATSAPSSPGEEG